MNPQNPTSQNSSSSQSTNSDPSSDLVLGMMTRRGLILTSVLGGLFIWLFNQWFKHQGQISWAHKEDWGHAFVIPLISGYMIWLSRKKIAETDVQIFWPAIVPFVMGIQAYAYNMFFTKNGMLQGFSMVMTLGALVLLCVGTRMFRHVFLPILYLILMVTIADSIMQQVTFKLQLIASQGSWLMLSLIGEPFGWFSVDLVGGNRLDILSSSGELHPLNVAEACSGMRMVVAFYALAGAVALLGCTQWWQRIALVLLAGPVAILMNMVRVTVLGLLTLVDPDLAAGDAHTLIGTILLVPSLGLFLGVVWALNRIIGTPDEKASSSAEVAA